MKLRCVRILLVSMQLLGLAAIAQTDINPYASEADLGVLIGENARVEGVFHKRAFSAPAIAISGRVFFLLENPPSQRTFDFPNDSRNATVEGILYLYDGAQQYSAPYQAFGKRYYFFSLDAAKIDFGDPLKASGAAADDPMGKFFGSWRFDVESTEAEIYKFEQDDIRIALSDLVELFRGAELVFEQGRIRMYMPSHDLRTVEEYEVVEQSDMGLTLKLTDPKLKISREWQIRVDGEGRLQIASDHIKAEGFTFFYNRW